MELEKNERGFAIVRFTDRYNTKCSLKKSSIATEDCIWLGVDDPHPQIMASDAKKLGLPTGNADIGWTDYHIPEQVCMTTHMHLTPEMVKGLLVPLNNFVNTGELETPSVDGTMTSANPWLKRSGTKSVVKDMSFKDAYIRCLGLTESLKENMLTNGEDVVMDLIYDSSVGAWIKSSSILAIATTLRYLLTEEISTDLFKDIYALIVAEFISKINFKDIPPECKREIKYLKLMLGIARDKHAENENV